MEFKNELLGYKVFNSDLLEMGVINKNDGNSIECECKWFLICSPIMNIINYVELNKCEIH